MHVNFISYDTSNKKLYSKCVNWKLLDLLKYYQNYARFFWFYHLSFWYGRSGEKNIKIRIIVTWLKWKSNSICTSLNTNKWLERERNRKKRNLIIIIFYSLSYHLSVHNNVQIALFKIKLCMTLGKTSSLSTKIIDVFTVLWLQLKTTTEQKSHRWIKMRKTILLVVFVLDNID